jgi:aminodeoxychorismate synthase component I
MKKHDCIFTKKLPSWTDPEKIFLKLFADESHAFWLDSSLQNDANRFSYMGVPDEIVTYDLSQNTTTVKKNETTETYQKDIFSYLDEQLKTRYYEETVSLPFDFTGGYIGYFGYELKMLCGAKKTSYSLPYPDSLWYFVKNFIAFDHKEKNVYLVCLSGEKNNAEKWFKEIQQKLKITLSSRATNGSRGIFLTPSFGVKDSSTRRTSSVGMTESITFFIARNKNQYLEDIQTCKEYLAKGESYQICLTNTITTETESNPLKLYLHLRQINPAPFAAFIKYDDLAILCSSPEQFLKINKKRDVETKPIKGTIKRGETPEEDKQLIEQLRSSQKDWSENAMIVDLLRNDLGKVCDFGSITVAKLMEIETYQTLHQLVSTVQGKLRKDKSIIDCVKACFPGGSMTGVPKMKTMEILDSLEKKPRGIYSGALGFLSVNNTANLNIVIRTIIIKGFEISIGAGGAILIDSDPEKEYEEMLLKAQILLELLTYFPNSL